MTELEGRVLRRTPGSHGYLSVVLKDMDRRQNRTVHSLVAAAFYGPRPEGMETRHLDGNPANNRVENLRYGTQSENNLDRVSHGTHHLARKTHCPQGHPYSGANLIVVQRSNGRQTRDCRTCARARQLAFYERRRRHEQSVYCLPEAILRSAS